MVKRFTYKHELYEGDFLDVCDKLDVEVDAGWEIINLHSLELSRTYSMLFRKEVDWTGYKRGAKKFKNALRELANKQEDRSDE